MCCVSFLVPLSVKSEHRFLSSVPDNHDVTNEALFELMNDPEKKEALCLLIFLLVVVIVINHKMD